MRKSISFKIFIFLTLSIFTIETAAFSQQAAPVSETLKKEEQPIGVTGPGTSGLPVESSKEVPTVNPYDIAIPETYGKIEEVFQGAPAAPLIVHIQDAHANYEAQKNIKQILDHLRRNYYLKLIQLEGAASKLDPSIFAVSYLKEANLKLADFLMRQGRLSGAEAFAVESENPVELYGVEDATLYIENLKTFRSVYSHQKELDAYFKEMGLVAKDLRIKLLNEGLLDLTRKMEEYSQEKIELLDYVLYLNELAERNKLASLRDLTELNRFPNLVRIVRLRDLEKGLDDKAVKAEADALKQVFSGKALSDEEKDFVSKLELQKKGVKPRAYFRRITALAGKHGVELLAYPNMRKFAEFLVLQDEVEHQGLFSEVSRLERLLQKKLFQSKEEQYLIDLLKAMELLKQYFRLEMNREKLAFVMKRYEKIKPSIIQKRLDYLAGRYGVKPADYQGDVTRLDKLMDEVEYFYRIVIERDSHFIQNVLSRMKESQTDRTVLITGGFHTDGVTRLLRKDNLSYIVVIPRIDVKQGAETYLKVMLESDTAVGSVFAGSFALQIAAHAVERAYFLGPVGEWVKTWAEAVSGAAVITAQAEVQATGTFNEARLVGGLNENLKTARIDSVRDLRYDSRTGDVTAREMRIEMPGVATVAVQDVTLTSDGKINGRIEVRQAVSGTPLIPAHDFHDEIPALPSSAGVIVPETPADQPVSQETISGAEETLEGQLQNSLVFDNVIPAGTLPAEALARVQELTTAYSVQCFSEELGRGLPFSEAVERALARTQAARVENFPEGRARQIVESIAAAQPARLLLVPILESMSEKSVDSQLVAVWQTLLANPSAGAVVVGKGVEKAAEELGIPQALLKRVEFIDTENDKETWARLADFNQSKLQGLYSNMVKPITPADFEKGVARVLLPEALKSFGALPEVPGLIQLSSPGPRDEKESEAVAAVQVMALHILPTSDETEEEFRTRIRDLGFDQMISRGEGNHWSFAISDVIKQLYDEFLAARLVAIRA